MGLTDTSTAGGWGVQHGRWHHHQDIDQGKMDTGTGRTSGGCSTPRPLGTLGILRKRMLVISGKTALGQFHTLLNKHDLGLSWTVSMPVIGYKGLQGMTNKRTARG